LNDLCKPEYKHNSKQINKGTNELIPYYGSVPKMDKNRFMVLVIKYPEKSEKNVKTLLENFTTSMDSKYGEAKLVYEGNDNRVIVALERVLKLTEQ
jgi:hypothetical protein